MEMRIIDADALKLDIMCVYGSNPQYINWLNHAPTIDAVPVVRCKDCKYYRDGDCWHEWDNDGRIYYQSIINEPNPDDYCSRAERRTDDLEAGKRI